MKTLIYAPELSGHPQVYCRVIARALLDAGHPVAIACPADPADWQTRWHMLRPLAGDGRVRCIDIRRTTEAPRGALKAEQLLHIQRECDADATLFIDADLFGTEFRRIAAGEAPRLRGRICAIFARASEWFPGEDAYTGQPAPVVKPTLRHAMGRIKRAIFNRGQSPRYFYEHVLIESGILDALVVKDERIARRFGEPVRWMPEIYRIFDAQPEERRGPDWDRYAEPIRRYIERVGPDKVLLYFGEGAWYKGYDYFLKLAQMDEGCFALHAGAPERGEKGKPYRYDVITLRQELLRQGRLFETSAFIGSGDLMGLVFGKIDHFASTHRLTLSSATMLQALEMGKPVLTPGSGLVGWRTREFKLGATYAYGDMADLAEKWRVFRTGAFDATASGIRSFMARFSRERTERFFVDLITGEKLSSSI